MSEPGKIYLLELKLDGGTQSRAGLNMATVNDYAEDMRQGDVFPPLDVFYDGTNYWLADGFHRVAAAKEAGFSELPATIHQGNLDAAILWSCGANKNHGLRRSADDKRRAVNNLFNHPTYRTWSNRAIADAAGVSLGLVNTMRHEEEQKAAPAATAPMAAAPATQDDDDDLFAEDEDEATTERAVQSPAPAAPTAPAAPAPTTRTTKDGRTMDVSGIAAANQARAKPKEKEPESRRPAAPAFELIPMDAAPAAATSQGQVLASVGAPETAERAKLKTLLLQQRLISQVSRRLQGQLDQVLQTFEEKGVEAPTLAVDQAMIENFAGNLLSSPTLMAYINLLGNGARWED